ncbi:hypothetical protein PIB30_030291 [Stylosanthes scabra]|uniref:BRCT domain-containing protein n=1 Tax=Stylosanthes scabra TaxID=79078 RepID=A0ABU6QC01_9FABA|nr:hypothetical protein [Stylosanthes scabra]
MVKEEADVRANQSCCGWVKMARGNRKPCWRRGGGQHGWIRVMHGGVGWGRGDTLPVVVGLFMNGGCDRVWRVAMEKRKRLRAVKCVVHDWIRKSMLEGKSRTHGDKPSSDKPRVVNNPPHVSRMYWLHYGSHRSYLQR